MIKKIECKLKNIRNKNLSKAIQKSLDFILKNDLSTPLKIIEISLIIFYLERDKTIPIEHSFLKFRIKEIKKEIKFININTISVIHSGTQIYLLRAFCNMSIFADGTTNEGGVNAVLHLLEGELAGYFKEENHLLHIREVFKLLISDSILKTLIEKPFERIHPKMEYFIRIDGKLPYNAPVTPQHIRIFLLIGLLQDLRQYFFPNCYAVATLFFGMKASPENILLIYRQLISGGCIEAKNGTKIPIAPLITNRLLFNPDLELIVDPVKFYHTAVYQSMAKVSGSRYYPQDSNPRTIEDILRSASHFCPFSPKKAYTLLIKTLSSFNRNILQEMTLIQMEFMEINNSSIKITENPFTNKTLARATKKQFIDFIYFEFKKWWINILKTQGLNIQFRNFAENYIVK